MPTWMWFNVPHGDGILDVYKMLIDTGIDGYWNEIAEKKHSGGMVKVVGMFGGLLDPHACELKEDVRAVWLRESLVLEALFLYGVGVGMAVIGALVHLLLRVWKYSVSQWKNIRDAYETRLIVRAHAVNCYGMGE